MKYAFLIPIGNSMSGKLIPQLLHLHGFCSQIDGKIHTISNRTHVDARNYLITNGGGFVDPTRLLNTTEWLVWIDSDQVFNLSQLKMLLDCDEPFCSGWYVQNTENPLAMVAKWDDAYFKVHHTMKFITANELLQSTKPLIEVDYVGFGFTKIKSSLVSQLQYPYFRQNVHKVGKYNENVSEDASFCLDIAKKTGVKPKVITKLKVGHLKEIVI